MDANENFHRVKVFGAKLLGRYILRPFVNWWRREAAFSELMSLDDRALKDIGVARNENPWLVAYKIVLPDAANDGRPAQSRPAQRVNRKFEGGCQES